MKKIIQAKKIKTIKIKQETKSEQQQQIKNEYQDDEQTDNQKVNQLTSRVIHKINFPPKSPNENKSNQKIAVTSICLKNSNDCQKRLSIQTIEVESHQIGFNQIFNTRSAEKKNRQMHKTVTLGQVNSIRQGSDHKLYNLIDKNINMTLLVDLFSNDEELEIQRNDRTPDKSKQICCNCKKTQCLKRYCECVKAGTACNSQCQCIECYNKPTLMKKEQGQPSLDEVNSSQDQAQQTSKKEGCSCKKSECKKKYCECFQTSMKCTELCKCFPCKNREENLIKITNHKFMNSLVFSHLQTKEDHLHISQSFLNRGLNGDNLVQNSNVQSFASVGQHLKGLFSGRNQ